jgi:hypothetical protein
MHDTVCLRHLVCVHSVEMSMHLARIVSPKTEISREAKRRGQRRRRRRRRRSRFHIQ